MTPSTTTSSSAAAAAITTDAPEQPGVRVPWTRLRAWIDAHEAHEKEHAAPAPLTQVQLEALSLLVSFGEEPDVGGHRHVSELMETLQARQLPLPVFESLPVNLPVNGHIQLMWRCLCTTTAFGSFPRRGHGLDDDEQPPAFQSKKNAKQYAAKLAMQYIRRETSSAVSVSSTHSAAAAAAAATTTALPTPAASIHTSSLAPPGPTTAKRKAAATSRSPTPSSTPNPSAHKPKRDESLPPQPPTQHRAIVGPDNCGGGGDNDDDGDEVAACSPFAAASDSVFKQVADLAARLGLDAPAYRIEPDPHMPNFFDGRAVFRSGGRTPPGGVGAVTAVLGKKQARVQVAEGVLEWLRGEQRARDAMVQSLWGPAGS
ncbi:hypothetical protein JDV02_000978 [Purpureocillium takamizusanense]|uniref:DRBM domain-containing protein n=2 Tax=Purpureocillium takamizusanense TaxID=2060973 RepID=A0A9Q8Q8D4_9HYPO|nr:uncharacterized protein JDV02_000978 [Purpureocillium takamizusanense]UNI14341.1 hypothetical protein JDV02_000978 [Purpureocillium takamizusanense]